MTKKKATKKTSKKAPKIDVDELELDSELELATSVVEDVLGADAVHMGHNSEYGEPKGYICTGIPELNLVLHRGLKGYPYGRIIEVFGGQSSCKSGLAYDLIARVQQKGGLAVLFPAEGEFSMWLAEKYGVDLKSLVIADTNIVEEVFATINKLVDKMNHDDPLLIVIDSIAGLCTKSEFEDESFAQDRQGMMRAQLLSKGLRKVGAKIPKTKTILFMVNQVNDGEATPQGFMSKPKPPGGRRIGFYASVRLRLETLQKVYRTKDKKKYVAGFKIKITAEKNRLADQYQECELIVDFEKGLMSVEAPKKKDK